MSAEPRYSHTQSAPLCLILYVAGVGMIAAAVWGDAPWEVAWILAICGAMEILLGASFQHLAVVDQGERLAIRFGPLPLFRTSLRYADLRSAEVARTHWLDGWGIHRTVRGGWLWNIWGRDCVTVQLKSGPFHIGTNDAEGLCAFLRERLAGNEEEVQSAK